ncbi:universal stress protein [Piscinibacter sp.]|jgi:nucleotide-binding universal stress UspA family protein|uniref:universal stress protein n=1 Tax=Piscinibacter sp. TaxID=1903157 RepID=UPI001DDF05CF|nr:universal stress protein [Piscinibacter sp.]MBK7531968.1 universal stress protein [Piscinibacter sp.]
MNETTPPQRIFMANDLSARCDRALARAAQLAQAWHGKLTVVHVVHAAEVAARDRLASGAPSWRRPESWSQTLERALRADLAAEGIAATSRVVIGTTPDAVLQGAADENADLVVLGIAKDARMDRIQLGSTVDALVRRSRVPVLNVRNRVRGAYRHVVVATDFSEPAMEALRLAAHWFTGARLTLFHAYMPPGSSLTSGTGPSHSWRDAVAQQCASHATEAELPKPIEAALDRVLEFGAPETLLPDFVTSAQADLVVLGSQGRSGLARALLGSTAENLLHTLDCDTLVVRGA